MTARCLTAVLLASLAACGGDGAPKGASAAPVRVEVIYASVDPGGPVDGFSLVGEDGKAWPLASQPALDRRVLAADAPGGRYRVVGPAGWGPVGPLEPLPLRGDLPPSSLWVGRTHSVYLLHPPELPVQQVDARRDAREGAPRALEPRLETGTDGRSVLRIPAEQWTGTFRLHVRLGETHFSKPLNVHLRGEGAPIHAVTEPSLMTTFDVLALPADGVPAAGLEVVGLSRIGDLKARVAAKTNVQGWARLDPVPVEAEDFFLEMTPDFQTSSVHWDGKQFRQFGEARLLAPPAREPESILSVDVPGGYLQVRAESSDTYLASHAISNGMPNAWLPPSRFHWIVRGPPAASGGGRPAASGLAEIRPQGGRDPVHRVNAVMEAAATLAVHIRGGFLTKEDRYDLHARRLEDGKEVFIVGGTLRNLLRRDADLSLPPGKYRVRLALGAKESAPKDVDLSTPGTRASIELDAPR